MGTLPRVALDASKASFARNWWFDVDIDGDWTAVRGVNNCGFDLPVSMDSITPLNSGGWDFPVKSSMGWAVSLTVSRKPTRDAVPVYDAGQEALRDAAEDQWGTIKLRWYKVDSVSLEAYSGTGIVQYVAGGGGPEDLDSASVSITGQGARSRITFPAVG